MEILKDSIPIPVVRETPFTRMASQMKVGSVARCKDESEATSLANAIKRLHGPGSGVIRRINDGEHTGQYLVWCRERQEVKPRAPRQPQPKTAAEVKAGKPEAKPA